MSFGPVDFVGRLAAAMSKALPKSGSGLVRVQGLPTAGFRLASNRGRQYENNACRDRRCRCDSPFFSAVSLIPKTASDRQRDFESDIKFDGEHRLSAILRDPESAKISGEYISALVGKSTPVALCGDVNARNGFGGYTGDRSFVVPIDPRLPVMIGGGGRENDDLTNKALEIACSNAIRRFDD